MPGMRWVKLSSDMFDDEKIVLISELPKSEVILLIWVKLLCLAGKQNNNGVFALNGHPMNTTQIAKVLHHPKQIVEKSLQVFVEYGMVTDDERGYSITNWCKHQSIEAIESRRARQREYVRNKRVSEASDNSVSTPTLQSLSTQTSVDSTHRTEQNRKETEKKRIEQTTTPSPSDVVVVVKQWNDVFGEADEEWLESMLYRYGNDVIDAIRISAASKEPITYPKKYVEGILMNWRTEGKELPKPKPGEYTQRPRNGEADRLERIKEAMNDAESEC